MKSNATNEQSKAFLKKIIGKTLESAEFISRQQPYECYVTDSKSCLTLEVDDSRIKVVIKNGIIVSGEVG